MSGRSELYAHCRAAWPSIAIEGGEAAFVRHIERHVPNGTELATLHAEDLYLACACAQGSEAALQEFERRYMSQIDHFLSAGDRQPAFLDELRQALRDKLFVGWDGKPPRIAEYSGRGSLHSWFRTAAVHTARNLQRGRKLDVLRAPGDAALSALASEQDPELGYLKGRYRNEFKEACQAAFSSLSPEQRDVIRMHYLEGLNIDRIGVRLGVNRATVARWRTAAQRAILDETKRQLRHRLRLSDSEFGSLARLVRSQLEVNLAAVLDPEPGGEGE